MNVILVILLVVLIVALFSLTARVTIAGTYPEALLLGCLSLIAFVHLVSETLNLASILRPGWIMFFWLICLAGLLAMIWRRRSRLSLPALNWDRQTAVIYSALVPIAAMTLLTGALVSPNNWDSLTYHLSRGAHWLQQGSFDFFEPTSSRENTQSPLGDLLFAHLQVAGGDGATAFLVQWFAGIVVLVGVGILADEVFADRRITALSVLCGATVPMLVSQMSTTQVDLLAGVPIAGVIVAWRWLHQGRFWGSVLLASSVMGVAAAIKATSALLILPWGAVMLGELFERRRWKHLGGFLSISVASLLVFNVGHIFRLLTQRAGSLNDATNVLNEALTPESVVVNLVRDLTTALVVPIPALVRGIETASEVFLEFLGLDPELRGATFGSSYSLSVAWSEDHAAAPWHVLLVMTAIAWLFVRQQSIPRRRVATLVGVLATQSLLIAAVIRWQPWINRFTFLIVVFAAPLMGWLLAQWAPFLRSSVASVMVVSALAWILLQPLRGLAGTMWIPQTIPFIDAIPRYESPLSYDRFSQMFMHHPPSADTYSRAFSHAQTLDPNGVQLDIGGDWWEFPIWVWMDEEFRNGLVMHYPEAASGRVVRICIETCSDGEMTDVRTFSSSGPASPSVDAGPDLVVGLVR